MLIFIISSYFNTARLVVLQEALTQQFVIRARCYTLQRVNRSTIVCMRLAKLLMRCVTAFLLESKVLIILFLSVQVAELQVEIGDLRIKHACISKETRRLQEEKHTEVEKVISASANILFISAG